MGYSVRFNPELKLWVVPVNDYSIEKIKYFIRRHKFKQTIPSEVQDVTVSYEKNEVDYSYLKGMIDAQDFSYDSRQYQIEALGYALDKGSFINGDDVGLGKTFEAIMYAETKKAFPCLVVVPASVKYNWGAKWYEITKERRSVSVIESGKKQNWDAEVVIINYDIIGKKQGRGATVKFEELLTIPWKMTIWDEAHFMKNKTAQRSKAAKKIIDRTIKERGAIIQMLTGTATMSKPIELWNLLILLHKDKLIAQDWYQFVRRYCGGYKGKFGWETGGATNTLELNRKLRENCYIRREKRDVFKEMPPVTSQVIDIPITNSRNYKHAVEDLIDYIRINLGEDRAEKAQEAEHLVQIGLLRKLAIEGKLKAVEQYLKDWAQGDTKLLVFGLHREPLDYLSEKFKCDIIAGGVSAKRKYEIAVDWKNNDKQFLFGNIDSMGTGVDELQHASSNILVLELPWRPSDISQLTGRLDRSGQKEAVTLTYLLSDETIDREMWEMLADKETVVEAVNKGVDVKRNKSGMRSVMKKIMKRNVK
jgi:SWI/SNF-related matrix-associated actin-dependent regulator 1 of chromatin subfamily A